MTRDCTIELNYQLKLPEISNNEGIPDLDFLLTRPGQKPFSVAEVLGKQISATAISLKLQEPPQDLSYEAYTNIMNELSLKIKFSSPPEKNKEYTVLGSNPSELTRFVDPKDGILRIYRLINTI